MSVQKETSHSSRRRCITEQLVMLSVNLPVAIYRLFMDSGDDVFVCISKTTIVDFLASDLCRVLLERLHNPLVLDGYAECCSKYFVVD